MQILDNSRYVLWWCGSTYLSWNFYFIQRLGPYCESIFAIFWYVYLLHFRSLQELDQNLVGYVIFFEDGQTLLTMNWTIFSSKHMVHKKEIHRFQKWKHPIVPALSRVVAITFFHLHWNSPTVVLITFRSVI